MVYHPPLPVLQPDPNGRPAPLYTCANNQCHAQEMEDARTVGSYEVQEQQDFLVVMVVRF